MADFDYCSLSCPLEFSSFHDCLDSRWNEEECFYDESPICFGCPFSGELTEFFS